MNRITKIFRVARWNRRATLTLGSLCALSCAVLISGAAHAEIPAILTDTVKKGEASINLLKDVTTAELDVCLTSGTMFLGVDVNEAANGLEKSTSQGVAIKDMELVLTTTEGAFSFTSYYTNTTAMIQEAGTTEASEFNTLFGQTGHQQSSQISSTVEGFDLSALDDVIEIRDIDYTGEITGATINVTFLDTANNAGDNEDFFDYSNGFETFAILGEVDAQTLDNANIGFADAPTTVTYTSTEPSGGAVAAPSGAPEPHWILLAALALLFLGRSESLSPKGGWGGVMAWQRRLRKLV